MKKTIFRLILAVLFILPTVIALVYCHHVRTAPPSEKDVTEIIIEDTNGKTVPYNRITGGEEADRAIRFFFNINKNATSVEALPEGVLGGTPYKVTMVTGAKKGEYRYYFSSDPNMCYYSAPDGSCYQMGPDNAAEFLSSEYAACYYPYSSLPKLLLSESQEVKPTEASWSYSVYGGQTLEADVSDMIGKEKQYFENNVIMSLSFDNGLMPTTSSLTITSDNESAPKVDGKPLQDFQTYLVDEPTVVHVTLTAEWSRSEETPCSGKATYSFDALVQSTPKFFVSQTDTYQGNFITVTGKNVADASAITFTSEPDIGYTPRFFADGATVKALIPFAIDLEPGTYKLTFTYAGVPSSSEVVLTEIYRDEHWINGDGKDFDATCSEEQLKAVDELADQMAQIAHPEMLAEGLFTDSPNYEAGRVPVHAFGQPIYLGDVERILTSRGAGFVYWGQGIAVKAMNSGTVVYAGETDHTGKTVIIEHGYGFKTWYYNLAEITVAVDQVVADGDVIGASGTTGFNDYADHAGDGSSGVGVAATVGGCFVDPQAVWNEGISFNDVN